MSAPGDGQDVSLLAFSFYDATPEARAATLERLRAAWEANTVLALGELVHVAALRADPTVASSWASGSLDEALEGLVERPYSMEPVVLRGTAEATIAELEARLKAAEMERDAAQARAEAIMEESVRATSEISAGAMAAKDKLTRLQVVVLGHAASLAKREHLPSDDRADWVECYGPELTWEIVRAEIERTQRALTAAARRLAEAAGSR